MAELADVQDLGSCAVRRVGSTPTTRTMNRTAAYFFAAVLSLLRLTPGHIEIKLPISAYNERHGENIVERIHDFQKRTPDPVSVEYIPTPSGVIPVYSIISFHSLTQFIGYGKYTNKGWGNVYLRGQTSLYDGYISPSVLRRQKINPDEHIFPVQKEDDIGKIKALQFYPMNYNKRIADYKSYLGRSIKSTIHFPEWNKNIIEPLLQHYGVRTHWLDVVDNTWIALWFALHQAKATIVNDREYIHMFESAISEYGYIFLIGSDAKAEDSHFSGMYRGETTIMVDLRKAVPSYFLRPHAQHALMLRKHSENCEDFFDYTDKVIGIAKISVADGLKWIGQTGLMSVQSLFPPPYYDTGYASLLNEYHNQRDDTNFIKHFGSIQNISY